MSQRGNVPDNKQALTRNRETNPSTKEKNHASHTNGKNHKVRHANPERRNTGLLIQGENPTQPIEAVGLRADLSGGAGKVAVNETSSVKRGRPRIGEPKSLRSEPWKALGMSERTYRRRLAEQRKEQK